MAYKFQLGAATMSGSLTQEGSFTLKDDDGSTKFSIDRDLGDISGSGLASLATINSNAAIAATGSITAGTSFIIGSADLNETDMEKLDGITNGTVAANKAVVVDADKDADGFRNIDGTGDLTMGTITMSGFTVDADGDTALKSLAVDDASNIGCDSDTDLLALDQNLFTVNGTQLMKGALSGSSTVYAVGNVSTSGNFVATGSMSSAGATITGTSALATVTATSLSASAAVLAMGAATFGSSLEVSGTVKLAGVTDTAVAVASDSFYFKDADGLVKSDTISDLVGLVAGDGLGAASGVMKLDINELTAADVSVANDSIAIVDADDSNLSRKESIADLVSAMAGAGLTATNGVLSTDAGAVTSFGDENANLAEGMNFGSANLSADRTLTLPASPSVGDVVRVKAPVSLGGNALIIQVDGGGSHTIDGVSSIRLESDFAAIACMFVAANTWRIF